MSEWKEYKLGEIITTNAKSIGKNYPFSQISYLDTGSITCNRIDTLQEFNIGEAPSRAKRLVSEDDIVYSAVRPNQLHYGYIKNPQMNLVVSTGFVTITCNQEKINSKYLYYSLTQPQSIEYLHSIAEASTSAYPSLKPSDIEALDILLPPLPEQKRIAGILSSLDDKIDLLTRQNRTLEAMAETLFQQYFIENPKENEIEDIQLGEAINTTSGGTPPRKHTEYYINGSIDWVKSKELLGTYIFETEERITKDALNNSSAKLIPENSVLIAMYGATVGEYGIISKEMTCNQAVCALIPNQNYPFTYLYLWAKYMQQEFINLACGAAQQNISQIIIKQQYVCGEINLIKKFHSIIFPYFAKLKNNQAQIRSLIKLRDTLLPKLMNNEIKTCQ